MRVRVGVKIVPESDDDDGIVVWLGLGVRVEVVVRVLRVKG